MFCPKCSQSQISDEMRFCSRCGFPLTTVALLLDNNGAVPSSATIAPQTCSRSRMATESFVLTIFSWAAGLLATLWFDHGGPFELLAKIAAIVFFAVGLIGLLRFLYAFMFVKSSRVESIPASRTNSFSGDNAQGSLPPRQPNPINDLSRINTREIIAQPSITEHTTRLLEGNDEN